MTKAFAFTVLIAVLILVGTAALAQGAASQPGAAPAPPQLMLMPRPSALQAMRLLSPQMAPYLAKRLNLSDTQKTQITDLLTKAENALKPKIEAQRKAIQEFVVAMADGGTTEALLTAAAEKTSKAELAIVAEKIKTLIQIRDILSDQQKAEFNKYVADRTMLWRTEGASPFGGTPVSPPAPPAPEATPDQGAK